MSLLIGSEEAAWSPPAVRQLVLAVDDHSTFLQLIRIFLGSVDCEVITAENAFDALEIIRRRPPDLVVADVHMPGPSGHDLCRAIKQAPATALIPVVLISSRMGPQETIVALESGADDVLSKPLVRAEFLARVRSLLRLKKIQDRLDDVDRVIDALARAAAAKQGQSAAHLERVGLTARALGMRFGLSTEDQANLHRGGLIHDIGQISVPDAVLMKPGPLNDEEWELIKRHPAAGDEIISPLRSTGALRDIVRGHHEHWDGSGYPDGLAEEQIPLLARIVSVADAYDSMCSDRPWRSALAPRCATSILQAGAGEIWDPDVVAVMTQDLIEFHSLLNTR
ncbi:MAG TPA: HD domain-containing phosphohydrolase [Candidatus Acidoferrales bacterium]|nr:HD domain-containing phosphohydrolase [Candidatus Acidoferrales bacterium]